MPNTTEEGTNITYTCKSLLTRTKAQIDYCPVQLCQANGTWREATLSCGSSECINGSSEDYIGSRVCTVCGKMCQRWDSQSLWPHPFTENSMFPEYNVTLAHNYCRDPNGTRGAPWCYTEDNSTEWEFCGIPNCIDVTVDQGICPNDYCGDPEPALTTDNVCSQTMMAGGYLRNIGSIIKYVCNGLLNGSHSLGNYCPVRTCQENFYWTSVSLSCGMNECYGAGQSMNYTGKRTCSASGQACLPWNSLSPQAHNFTSSDFPDTDIHEAGTYCRDPNGTEGQPWCFINETTMEYCEIPECSTLPVNYGKCKPPNFHTKNVLYKLLNESRSGFDLHDSIPSTRTPTSCCRLCNQRPPCVMVTYNSTGGACNLYKENATVLDNVECTADKCYLIEHLF
ncbi:plasminogen-like [Ruditapes philippinarum]|uniref:plasminogen-like n=1 Tax=Ruditapes philippinarum TaxID=129788 RepID=UPI00295A8E25|nr:plasminogen-like [Ruditapes philippinarum]